MNSDTTLHDQPLVERSRATSHAAQTLCLKFKRTSLGLKLQMLATLLLVSAAIITAADASYLQLKAVLAQHLIERAWQQNLQSDAVSHKPWPWADTTPVARLQLPAARIDTRVLEGSDGTALAFAPGMSAGSSKPGKAGTIVIGAHRDTHFKNLGHVTRGDTIRLQDRDANWHEYRIVDTTIADIRTDEIVTRSDRARLLLITCYPFNALLPGGPLRYVLEAELVS